MNIVEFIKARLHEDTARQQGLDAWHAPDCASLPDGARPTFPCDCGVPARVLDDADAKRRVLTWHHEEEACSVCLDDVNACPVFTALAYPYRNHPDWRGEWRL